MLRHALAIVACLSFLVGSSVPSRAQYGWGGWGGASTVAGDAARGMGVFAAGAGQYNVNTAQARSINAQTAMQYNQYLYECQQSINQHYYERRSQEKQTIKTSANAIYTRLHDNPEPHDIEDGDALNVVLDELSSPKVYVQALSGASTPLPGSLIRNIPFQYAAAAITVSIHELTKPGGAPAVFRTPIFASLREKFQAQAAELRKQGQEKGEFDPKTLAALQDLIQQAWKTLDEAIPDKDSRDYRAAERYLKSLHGFFRMMESPDLSDVLEDVAKRTDTTLGDLLKFMTSFNLRFGVATTPEQQAVYRQVYPLLVQLRDQAVPAEGRIAALPTSPVAPTTAPPQALFEGMDRSTLSTKSKIPPPPPPAPGTN